MHGMRYDSMWRREFGSYATWALMDANRSPRSILDFARVCSIDVASHFYPWVIELALPRMPPDFHVCTVRVRERSLAHLNGVVNSDPTNQITLANLCAWLQLPAATNEHHSLEFLTLMNSFDAPDTSTRAHTCMRSLRRRLDDGEVTCLVCFEAMGERGNLASILVTPCCVNLMCPSCYARLSRYPCCRTPLAEILTKKMIIAELLLFAALAFALPDGSPLIKHVNYADVSALPPVHAGVKLAYTYVIVHKETGERVYGGLARTRGDSESALFRRLENHLHGHTAFDKHIAQHVNEYVVFYVEVARCKTTGHDKSNGSDVDYVEVSPDFRNTHNASSSAKRQKIDGDDEVYTARHFELDLIEPRKTGHWPFFEDGVFGTGLQLENSSRFQKKNGASFTTIGPAHFDRNSLAAIKRLVHKKKISIGDVQRKSSVYRKIAAQLHPNRGGNAEQFKVLTDIRSNRSGKWQEWNTTGDPEVGKCMPPALFSNEALAYNGDKLDTGKHPIHQVQTNSKVYRKLAQQLHPSKEGGKAEYFQILSNIHKDQTANCAAGTATSATDFATGAAGVDDEAHAGFILNVTNAKTSPTSKTATSILNRIFNEFDISALVSTAEMHAKLAILKMANISTTWSTLSYFSIRSIAG
ncbi:hypothetical protein T492DRAFT_841555 [Pavlovales sp. CCMP2436]|nr:hypothetical protein T492DRAFT_841555 [Pavlovales sp. CCMP2436]